jgi:hypothetical protein
LLRRKFREPVQRSRTPKRQLLRYKLKLNKLPLNTSFKKEKVPVKSFKSGFLKT